MIQPILMASRSYSKLGLFRFDEPARLLCSEISEIPFKRNSMSVNDKRKVKKTNLGFVHP